MMWVWIFRIKTSEIIPTECFYLQLDLKKNKSHNILGPVSLSGIVLSHVSLLPAERHIVSLQDARAGLLKRPLKGIIRLFFLKHALINTHA